MCTLGWRPWIVGWRPLLLGCLGVHIQIQIFARPMQYFFEHAPHCEEERTFRSMPRFRVSDFATSEQLFQL